MKNEKGITLITLVVYIAVLSIIIAIVGIITSNFYNNMKKVKTQATNLDEYNQLIAFFIEDIKRTENSVSSINQDNTEITFTSGNIYTFDSTNNVIRFNNSIIVNNVTACTFVLSNKEEKTIVTVSITIDGKNYTTEYSTKYSNTYNVYNSETQYLTEIEFELPENIFVTKWTVSAGESIILPIYNASGYIYNFTVNYGDGTGIVTIDSYNDSDRMHTYESAGTYTVVIKGVCEGWSFKSVATSKDKIVEIVSWGDLQLKDFSFYKCINLAGNVSFPKDIETIPAYAFCGCTGLTGTLTIPNTVTTIANSSKSGEGAFYGCAGLTGNLTFPEGLKTIGEYAFYSCIGLTGNLIFPEGITQIGTGAFSYCTGFTGDIHLPEGITVINGSFAACTGLDGILTFGEGITSIESGSFYQTKLKIEGDINLPLCTSIGMSAFRMGPTANGFWNLPECITLGGYNSIPPGITGINIPKVQNIASSAMINTNIHSLVLPSIKSLSGIGYNNNLKYLDLGEELTSIGTYVIYYGTKPSILIERATNPPNISKGENKGLDSSKICVPFNSIDSYKSATGWQGWENTIGGFKTYSEGETLTRAEGYITTTWYPTQDDIINGSNGVIADGTNTATVAGEWYCTVAN